MTFDQMKPTWSSVCPKFTINLKKENLFQFFLRKINEHDGKLGGGCDSQEQQVTVDSRQASGRIRI